jgi:hypothetical protein
MNDVAPGEDDECVNCGMIDVPLKDGHCSGCICLSCKKTAEEAGGSMNDMGWCNACEGKLQAAAAKERDDEQPTR